MAEPLMCANAAAFDAAVAAAGSKLVVIDFTASWCGPCKRIAPVYHEMAQTYNGKAVLLKVDVDENEEIAARFSIRSMPTFVFLKSKAEVERFSGASPEKLKETIEKLL
eukprot:TRINITY_DN3882_c0_g1_i1.p1 TRINITY_DN3882_c0_g1~~TRINITY_DN3882_c0_g1_i1.p1  ORF type:complete len:119 (-),score=41.45 TRINITY_DN3882_c0_g1_i1:51-377(-)